MDAASRGVRAASMSVAGATVREQSFLAFDFGTRRVGVASGNSLLRQSRGLKTIAAAGDARFVAIERLLSEWQPEQ